MRRGLSRFSSLNIGLVFFCVFIWSPRMAARPDRDVALRTAPRQLQPDAAQPGSALPASSVNERMEQVVQSYVSNKQFMGSVLAARGNTILLNKGYGFANLEWNTVNSPQSEFRLGSVTKQFTAAAIMLLEERGKVNVNDPVKKYMADAPAAWDRITIFHLLTHTSGIPDYTRFPDYRSLETVATKPAILVARFKDKPLDFQPGERWSYSNNYVDWRRVLAVAARSRAREVGSLPQQC